MQVREILYSGMFYTEFLNEVLKLNWSTHQRHCFNHTETIQLTCRPIQSTGFYMMGLFVNYLKLRPVPSFKKFD